MMERSSFFNAELKGEEYDRVYSAEDYARYFAAFIGNGVFTTPSTKLQVVADGTTMNLTLKSGKAWINGYFYENTEDLSLSVDVADGVLNRIDRVVVRLDFVNREIKAYVKKGAFASSPVAPTLQRDSDMYELGIADIKISKGVTKLVQADVTDLRQNNNYCGLVSGVVDQIDTTNLFAQFQSAFEIWFEHIKGQLSIDQAGNLQNQIDESKSDISNIENTIKNKVDKIQGKGLSTNDYTDTEKEIVAKVKDKQNKSDTTSYLKLVKCNELAGSYTVLEFYVSGSVTDNPTSVQSVTFDNNGAAQTLVYDSLITVSAALKKVKFYVSGDVRDKFTAGNGYWIYRRNVS